MGDTLALRGENPSWSGSCAEPEPPFLQAEPPQPFSNTNKNMNFGTDELLTPSNPNHSGILIFLIPGASHEETVSLDTFKAPDFQYSAFPTSQL